MPNARVPAAGGAMPAEGPTFNTTEELAAAFIAALRGAGHRPYVDERGTFFIALNTHPRTDPEPEHHLGPDRVYFLGFDTRPFDGMRADPHYIAKLIAVLEAEGDQ
jgi:hypothetical protein